MVSQTYDYCGCCGRRCGRNQDWCERCKKHIDPKKTLWDATYFAQHGENCPYQNQAKNFGMDLADSAPRSA